MIRAANMKGLGVNDYCDSTDIAGSTIVDYNCNTTVILLSETFMFV